MVRFKISPSNLKKWLHQNKAENTGEFVEGSLLDNFVVSCKRGFAAVYERYVNPWVSEYLVEFQAGSAPDVWKRWFEFAERSEGDGKEYV